MSLPVAMIGMVDLQAKEGSAGVAYCDIRPQEHEIWVINQMNAYHDDPAGLTLLYNIFDGGATPYEFGSSGALAVSTKTYLYDDVRLPEPVVLTYDHFMRIGGAGIAAGKKIYAQLVVTIFRGLPTGYGI